MANPTFTQGAIGGALTRTRLAASANLAAYFDFTTKIEGQVSCRVSTSGAVTANSYTKNEAYHVFGSTALNGAVSAAARDIVVNASTGMASGTKIVIENELRTVLGVNGTAVAIDALLYSHSDAAAIYVIEREPTFPGSNGLGGTAATTFSKTTYLPTGKWCMVLSNTDVTNAVAVEITSSTIDSFA